MGTEKLHQPSAINILCLRHLRGNHDDNFETLVWNAQSDSDKYSRFGDFPGHLRSPDRELPPIYLDPGSDPLAGCIHVRFDGANAGGIFHLPGRYHRPCPGSKISLEHDSDRCGEILCRDDSCRVARLADPLLTNQMASSFSAARRVLAAFTFRYIATATNSLAFVIFCHVAICPTGYRIAIDNHPFVDCDGWRRNSRNVHGWRKTICQKSRRN